MGSSKRVRRGRTGWLKLISSQTASGLPVADFCRREGINAALFRRWQATLQGSRSGPEVVGSTAAAPFIDLGALRSEPRLEIRLDLGGGMVLSIARG